MSEQGIKSYKDLRMWQKAKDFAVKLYGATSGFPKEELYGITSQLRRAGVSVPSNIAEGFMRRSGKEKARFLRIAYGSGAEVETQLLIAKELNYLTEDMYGELVDDLSEVMKMVNAVLGRL